jgi:hypothetical protein
VDLIRPFQRDDIPEVSQLFRRAFLSNGDHDAATIQAYFERAFFANPWYDDELPSYVHLDDNGAVDGFVGVQPKRLRWQGRRLRVAGPTKLMTAPTATPLVASRLLRRVFAGPQDLLLSDVGNDAGRRIWEALGGATVFLYSLQWQRPVRPAGHALSWLRARGVPGAITQSLRPFGALADTLLARWSSTPSRALRDEYLVEDLPFDVLATGLPELLAKRVLQPEYDEPWLRWLLGIAQQKEPSRVLRRQLVRDANQAPAGWFLYLVERGGVAEVLQLVARKNASAMVLDALLDDARREGATMVSGKLEPSMLREMSEQHCYIRPAEHWTLAHSNNPEIMDAILNGNAFLSRLEGEW